MADTIKDMSYVKVDILTSGQLEPEDLILVNGDVVNVVEVIPLADGYSIEIVDDYGDREVIHAEDFEQFSLMMLEDDLD